MKKLTMKCILYVMATHAIFRLELLRLFLDKDFLGRPTQAQLHSTMGIFSIKGDAF